MFGISQSTLDSLKKRYPKGTRVELVRMDDVQAPPAGTHGTVTGVDGIGTIHIDWDNGSTIGAVYGEDVIKKISRICPVCGKPYTGYPALSRRDNKTEICPDCGMAEALEASGLIKLTPVQ